MADPRKARDESVTIPVQCEQISATNVFTRPYSVEPSTLPSSDPPIPGVAARLPREDVSRFRLPLALMLSVGLSGGLFWLLRTLIGVTGEFEQIAPPPKIEFVRLRIESEVEEKVRVKPQIEKPEPPPSAEAVATSEKVSVMPGADLAALAPSVDFAGSGGAGGVFGGASLGSSGAGVDRDAVPQVRIQPDYPIQARQRRIEGWVDVLFTVAADGSVRNPVVIGAEPRVIFDRAALQAVKGWKYNPKIEDGRAVERPEMRVRIRFQLES
jgi:protein TonB